MSRDELLALQADIGAFLDNWNRNEAIIARTSEVVEAYLAELHKGSAFRNELLQQLTTDIQPRIIAMLAEDDGSADWWKQGSDDE